MNGEMKSIVGHLRLTHIIDGVLHGQIVPLCNPEVGPLWGVAEFDLSKPSLSGMRLSTACLGLFGPIDDPSDVPIAYPKKTETWEITAEMLKEVLADSKELEKEGWLAPVYLE